MTESDRSIRRLDNWLDHWMEYTAILPSPVIFRKWAGIAVLAGAMRRQVWMRAQGLTTYPNLYVVLVGPPGTGKSVVVSPAEKILQATKAHVAPSSVTTASLIDSLVGTKDSAMINKDLHVFNALFIGASELGVFLPAYDSAFMNTLTKLYDGETYEERRRTKDLHIKIDNPLLTILAGTTPGYLHSMLPDVAWDQGLMSRIIFVFAADHTNGFVWADPPHNNKLYVDLLHDLQHIVIQAGPMMWEQEAADVMFNWIHAGLKPVPFHTKLTHYNTRRRTHMFKLCMIASMSRGSSRIITLEDFQTAQEWLLEAEGQMTEIFQTVGLSQDSRIQDDAWYYIYSLYTKNGKKPVPESELVNFLRSRVASYQISSNIQTMLRTGSIKMGDPLHGVITTYIPIQKVEGRSG